MKSLGFLGLMALATVMLHGQSITPPTTGAQYWSTNSALDCSGTGSPTYTIPLASGGTGYVCIVSGTFPWLAAGGSWATGIRAAAPAAGAIGVDYTFYDVTGNSQTLDTTSGSAVFPTSTNELSFALNANQPSEIHLLGASNEAPRYTTTQTGTVYGVFYCPNADACATVLPQLVYSFTPIQPWSLSVPISWDTFFSAVQPEGVWTQWSATGVNDATHFVSMVVYNQNSVPTIFTVRVYDNNGSQVGTGTTAAIPGGTTVEGGTQGALLSSIITTPLPTGVFKVTVDGGSNFSSVSFLQFSGASATSLQVAYDTASATSTIATASVAPSALRLKAKRSSRLPSTVLPK